MVSRGSRADGLLALLPLVFFLLGIQARFALGLKVPAVNPETGEITERDYVIPSLGAVPDVAEMKVWPNLDPTGMLEEIERVSEKERAAFDKSQADSEKAQVDSEKALADSEKAQVDSEKALADSEKALAKIAEANKKLEETTKQMHKYLNDLAANGLEGNYTEPVLKMFQEYQPGLDWYIHLCVSRLETWIGLRDANADPHDRTFLELAGMWTISCLVWYCDVVFSFCDPYIGWIRYTWLFRLIFAPLITHLEHAIWGTIGCVAVWQAVIELRSTKAPEDQPDHGAVVA